MLGISWAEFLVILLVAICVVPVKYWPDVARFMGRAFKYIRDLIWKINDVNEQIQHRIDLEKPIDDLLQNAVNDTFVSKTIKNKKRKKINKK